MNMKALNILFFLFLSNYFFSQELKEQIEFKIHFVKNSTKFRETKSFLDSIYKYKISTIRANQEFIQLMPIIKADELKHDNFLHLKRCAKIIEYFHKEYGIDESVFIIIYSTQFPGSPQKEGVVSARNYSPG